MWVSIGTSLLTSLHIKSPVLNTLLFLLIALMLLKIPPPSPPPPFMSNYDAVVNKFLLPSSFFSSLITQMLPTYWGAVTTL